MPWQGAPGTRVGGGIWSLVCVGIGCEWAQGPPEIGSAAVPLVRGAGQASCDDLERKTLGKGAWGGTLIQWDPK